MKYILILLLALFPMWLLGQIDKEVDPTWNLAAEKNGIKVYTRIPDEGTIKELRILAEIEGNLDTLVYIVNDAENFCDWVYKCCASAKLTPPEDYTVAYTETSDFPFPMYDRELLAKSKQWREDDGSYHMHSFSAHDLIPENEKIVRIEHYESRWKIEHGGENIIFVDYTSSVDPGGNIPTWVINLGITTGPIKTFTKLIELVGKRSNLDTATN